VLDRPSMTRSTLTQLFWIISVILRRLCIRHLTDSRLV